MGEEWTPEEWASWAKSMEGSTWILEKGEKVVMPTPSTPEQAAERKAQWDALWESFGRRGVVRHG